MSSDKEILSQIKNAIHEIAPDAKVFLFGSRATGKWHEESDWDFLVLTAKKYPKAVKWRIHEKLFSLSVSIGTVFQFIVATNEEWKHKPGYYALQLEIQEQLVPL